MDRVRIGLVGCGNFGESHLQAFRAIPQAELPRCSTLTLTVHGGSRVSLR